MLLAQLNLLSGRLLRRAVVCLGVEQQQLVVRKEDLVVLVPRLLQHPHPSVAEAHPVVYSELSLRLARQQLRLRIRSVAALLQAHHSAVVVGVHLVRQHQQPLGVL